MPAAASSRPGLVAGTAPASQQTAVAAPPAQPAQPPSRPASPAQPGQTAAPASTESAHRDWAAAATLTHTHTPHTVNTLCVTLATQPRVCSPEDVCAGPGLGGGGGGGGGGQPPASRQTAGRGRHSHQAGLHSSTTHTPFYQCAPLQLITAAAPSLSVSLQV